MVHSYLSDLKLYPTLNIIKYNSEEIYSNGILFHFVLYSDKFYCTLEYYFKRFVFNWYTYKVQYYLSKI